LTLHPEIYYEGDCCLLCLLCICWTAGTHS
jgi:hypothetical protein